MATYDVLPATPQPQRADIWRATAWISEGWRAFARAPGVWIAITIALFVFNFLISLVPLLGQIATAMLMPVFAAGLMECSRVSTSRATPDEALRFDHMFAGFRRNTGNLVMLGLLNMIFFVAISTIAFVILAIVGGSALLQAIQSGSFTTVDFLAAYNGILIAALVWLLFAVPLSMALWFAPALVMYDNLTPIDAMKSSFHASLRNWLSLSIYGVVLCMLAFIAAIPLGLGFLLLIPVAAVSVYLSYRDIYH